MQLLHWLRDHRRETILKTPFPAAWDGLLRQNVVHYRRLKEDQRHSFQDLIRIFVAEKHWEGCGGLELTDEIRVTIAAQACLLILALPHDFYRNVDSILIYPSTIVPPERNLGVFEVPRAPMNGPMPILGEAHQRGPVILAWDSVKRAARHPETGHNVVYHEFAHALDSLDGGFNGTPPLTGREEYARWAKVCEREFLDLRARSAKGERTFLDPYGATNEAEFFAVATEYFFDRPTEMDRHHAELYNVLRDFYRQDPARLDEEWRVST